MVVGGILVSVGISVGFLLITGMVLALLLILAEKRSLITVRAALISTRETGN